MPSGLTVVDLNLIADCAYRLGRKLPRITTQAVSTPWLRHTYIKPSFQDVATALVAMTGEPHPLAHPAATRATHDIRTAPRFMAQTPTSDAMGSRARLFTLYRGTVRW